MPHGWSWATLSDTLFHCRGSHGVQLFACLSDVTATYVKLYLVTLVGLPSVTVSAEW